MHLSHRMLNFCALLNCLKTCSSWVCQLLTTTRMRTLQQFQAPKSSNKSNLLRTNPTLLAEKSWSVFKRRSPWPSAIQRPRPSRSIQASSPMLMWTFQTFRIRIDLPLSMMTIRTTTRIQCLRSQGISSVPHLMRMMALSSAFTKSKQMKECNWGTDLLGLCLQLGPNLVKSRLERVSLVRFFPRSLADLVKALTTRMLTSTKAKSIKRLKFKVKGKDRVDWVNHLAFYRYKIRTEENQAKIQIKGVRKVMMSMLTRYQKSLKAATSYPQTRNCCQSRSSRHFLPAGLMTSVQEGLDKVKVPWKTLIVEACLTIWLRSTTHSPGCTTHHPWNISTRSMSKVYKALAKREVLPMARVMESWPEVEAPTACRMETTTSE